MQFLLQSCDKKEENPLPALSIGDFHSGGVIFYLDGTKEHGLVCSVIDPMQSTLWGCPDLVNFGANGIEIGTGTQNTSDILNACNEPNIAAAACANFESNGYDDWYLPSKDELDSLYQHRDIVSEVSLLNNGSRLNAGEYWSSSHQTTNTVWIQNFNAGNQFGDYKDAEHYVRAIRYF